MADVILHHGDNLDILPTLPRSSVQTVVTSPPYYGLRDYGIPPSQWPAVDYAPMAGLPLVSVEAQTVCLGLETDPLAYVGHLVHVFRLLRDVLKDDGTVWVNIGDSYASTSDGSKPHTGMRVQPSNAVSQSRTKMAAGLKTKDLIGIPWRVAFALQADGWYLRSDVIWSKPNAMPESVKDRPTKAHEYLFLLAKSERYFYDADAVAEPVERGWCGSKFTTGKTAAAREGLAPVGQGERTERDTRNARSVFTIPTRALAEAHYAPMPEALAERCIRAGSRPGDMVLDPFAGSGTTVRVAERLQRNGVGIELRDAYIEIAERRTDGVQLEMIV